LYEQLLSHGCTLSGQGTVPFKSGGKLKSGRFTLPGNVSSQFIRGLLLALPLLEGDSVLEITGDLESESYIDRPLAPFSIRRKNRLRKQKQVVFNKVKSTIPFRPVIS
jgi:3-phosphoshikimate 1-carboxyvinyltransferase